ncbi:hypothetical protein [Neolewinella antarctica]|uniref:Glyoxalase superfamily protein PhnB n=1 Tax=Neolewinella antarctica TaxID=442734 RepID=A0ABX0XAJ4_9BACT|nr:hypothetical protein [Neolewinella antarctica]NJC25817.1 putative glyoxalase superfamily protein PhnB [Neolewinella antarctica]
MSDASPTFQHSFLERVRSRFNSRSELVRSLGETLGLGRDAIYRRLRGDTALTADELVTISRKYRVPIEEGRDLSNVPVMYYHNGEYKITDDEDYFRDFRKHTVHLLNLPGVRVDYATSELPIFYELSPPVLRAFKVYIFGVTTWRLKKWEGIPFSPALLSPATNEVIEGIIEDAYRLPARELWSIGILDVTLRQITYMAQVGRFADDKDLLTIFEELHGIVNHLEQMAKSGKRFRPGTQPTDASPDFSVSHNELSNTNNAIIINSDAGRMMFNTLVNPNYLMTTDPRILNDVASWFERLVENGNALNNASGKYTNQYFGRLRQQIDATKDRVSYTSMIF